MGQSSTRSIKPIKHSRCVGDDRPMVRQKARMPTALNIGIQFAHDAFCQSTRVNKAGSFGEVNSAAVTDAKRLEWRCNPMRCTGAIGLPGDAIRWQVWAPAAKRVDLVLVNGDRRDVRAMVQDSSNQFCYQQEGISEGQRYVFSVNGGPDRPDPCSLSQPDGVHGCSAVVRPERFRWTDHPWRGVGRENLIFYELHVGAFTPEGTFAAIIPRLADLRDLGITAIELMPVAQFPG